MDNDFITRMIDDDTTSIHAPKKEVISLVKKAKKYGTKRLLKIAKKKQEK